MKQYIGQFDAQKDWLTYTDWKNFRIGLVAAIFIGLACWALGSWGSLI